MSLDGVISNPSCIFLLSGKRKSGKDYFTDLLFNRLGPDNAVVIKLSAPIKKHWAESCGLDLSKLLDSTSYKESYRQDMIKWGESMREKDYGYFCRSAIDMCQAFEKRIWIVSDVRRKTDIKWFCENYKNIKTLRISADINVREERGWIFTQGVDDAPSECDLDNYGAWNLEIVNNGNKEQLQETLNAIVGTLRCLETNL